MNPTPAVCPVWLANLFRQAGGVVPFRQYMEWALFHPERGYYGSGQVRIGPAGDFATSPSLGSDFAELLAQQLIALLQSLSNDGRRLSLVEVGPGEGDLAADLLQAIADRAPDLLQRLELVLVERSAALRSRQQQRIAKTQIDGASMPPLRWCSLEELAAAPVQGVVLAHELLDALPVDRVVFKNGRLQLQGVALQASGCLDWCLLPLPEPMAEAIAASDCALPPLDAAEGWCSEWHDCYGALMQSLSAAIDQGVLLVIDYALEAKRYYSSIRADGTLMACRSGVAALAPLESPGAQDLTSHVCIESLNSAAASHGWNSLDQRRQGEMLLALGLAERLHALQQLPPHELPQALQRREALLRLVDPAGLGEFRWLLFGRGAVASALSLQAAPES